MIDLLAVEASASNPTFITVLYSTLLAFLLSTLIAWVYQRTFRGLSYSENFLQSLILSSIVASTIMQAIGDSVGRGLGMLGALAIVRFRTNFKEPRDIIFLFSALAAGVGTGVHAFGVALAGTLIFCLTALVLAKSSFGAVRRYDGVLRLAIGRSAEERHKIDEIFAKFLDDSVLLNMREGAQGKRIECSWQVRFMTGVDRQAFMHSLGELDGVSGLHLMLQSSMQEL